MVVRSMSGIRTGTTIELKYPRHSRLSLQVRVLRKRNIPVFLPLQAQSRKEKSLIYDVLFIRSNPGKIYSLRH